MIMVGEAFFRLVILYKEQWSGRASVGIKFYGKRLTSTTTYQRFWWEKTWNKSEMALSSIICRLAYS